MSSTSPTAATPDELSVAVDLVRELKKNFGAKDEKLRNYAEILSHLDRTMEEHNEVHRRKFVDFCTVNRLGILARDIKQFRATVLEYRSGVFEIDFGKIWVDADDSQRAIIWRYLLTILAMTSEEPHIKNRAKSALSEMTRSAAAEAEKKASAPTPASPYDFSQAMGGIVGSMLEKMSSNPNAAKIAESNNVEDAIKLMLESGIVSDVMSAFTNQDGTANLESTGDIFGAMSGMFPGVAGGQQLLMAPTASKRSKRSNN